MFTLADGSPDGNTYAPVAMAGASTVWRFEPMEARYLIEGENEREIEGMFQYVVKL